MHAHVSVDFDELVFFVVTKKKNVDDAK